MPEGLQQFCVMGDTSVIDWMYRPDMCLVLSDCRDGRAGLPPEPQPPARQSFPDTIRVIPDKRRAPTPTHAPIWGIRRAPSSARRAKSPARHRNSSAGRAKHPARHPKRTTRHPICSAHHPHSSASRPARTTTPPSRAASKASSGEGGVAWPTGGHQPGIKPPHRAAAVLLDQRVRLGAEVVDGGLQVSW